MAEICQLVFIWSLHITQTASFLRLGVIMLVDVERASYPSAASRLPAACSNFRVPPLIHPYPPRLDTLLKMHAPSPQRGRYLSRIWSRKTHRTGREGDRGAGSVNNYFQKPSVHGFPISNDRVDRSCRLTSPSPLPCHAWHGNRVTNSHHEEVGVSVDVHASAPPSGATAVTPPIGAMLFVV
jgi:hypothetical protein